MHARELDLSLDKAQHNFANGITVVNLISLAQHLINYNEGWLKAMTTMSNVYYPGSVFPTSAWQENMLVKSRIMGLKKKVM